MRNFPTTLAGPREPGSHRRHGKRNASSSPAPRPPRSWKTGKLIVSISAPPSQSRIAQHRVRLFNKGDKISTSAKHRKLKREYLAIKKLAHTIYWTDVGREGASHIREQMRNRKMAENMAEMDPDISIEKAQKMIRLSMEAQRKADASRRSRYNRATAARYACPAIMHAKQRSHPHVGTQPRPGRQGTNARGHSAAERHTALAITPEDLHHTPRLPVQRATLAPLKSSPARTAAYD